MIKNYYNKYTLSQKIELLSVREQIKALGEIPHHMSSLDKLNIKLRGILEESSAVTKADNAAFVPEAVKKAEYLLNRCSDHDPVSNEYLQHAVEGKEEADSVDAMRASVALAEGPEIVEADVGMPFPELTPRQANVLLNQEQYEGLFMTPQQWNKQQLTSTKNDANKLIRVKILNQNPNKKAWPGEIISVGSAKLGTFKEFIPFNTGEPWHIPKIVYDYLKDRQCTIFVRTKNKRGMDIDEPRFVNEFILEVLDPLTQEEVRELGRKQALSNAAAA